MKFLLWIIDFFSTVKMPPPMPQDPIPTPTPPTPVTPAVEPPAQPQSLLWDTPKQAYHSTRVLCDERGLSVEAKNLICACIYQESGFRNAAVNRNKNKQGQVLSTDWGIVQINSFYNIGKGKPFPSAEYVVANPEAAVRWMIDMYKHGLLKLWVSYSSGAYDQWLKAGSPMWQLAK